MLLRYYLQLQRHNFFCLVTNKKAARVLSRIYCLGEKSRVTEGHEVPRGSGSMLPRKFFEMNVH